MTNLPLNPGKALARTRIRLRPLLTRAARVRHAHAAASKARRFWPAAPEREDEAANPDGDAQREDPAASEFEALARRRAEVQARAEAQKLQAERARREAQAQQARSAAAAAAQAEDRRRQEAEAHAAKAEQRKRRQAEERVAEAERRKRREAEQSALEQRRRQDTARRAAQARQKPGRGEQHEADELERRAAELQRKAALARERAKAQEKLDAKRKAAAKADARARRKQPALQAPTGRAEALGWFALAAVILAWPRRTGLFGDPDAPPLFPRAAAATSRAEVTAAALREPGRGRGAHNPAQIPLEGWKDILARTWHDFNEDRITSVAGGVTFFGLLALFPAMGAFVSLYGLFADVATAQKQLSMLAGVLPADALTFVGTEMIRIAEARHEGLGFAFVTGLLLSLWSANAGVKAMFEGLNIAFEERETRGFIKLNLVSLVFTIGAIVFLMLALGAVVVAPVALDVIGFGSSSVLPILRWPLLFLVVVGALAVLYRYGPSREHERWKWVTWGSLIAAVLWLLASLAFSFYVSNFGHYDKTYGSLGAVIGFMSWIWVSTIVVLFGAELNSEIEHQTAVDTTDGAPTPMGTRGAKMADTLGAARGEKKT